MKSELVTTLKRKATSIIKNATATETPVLITQHGKPAAYLIDIKSFDTMQRRLSILEGIARGERDIQEGRTMSHDEAKKRLGRWLK
jgi:prevent-host-death family protein